MFFVDYIKKLLLMAFYLQSFNSTYSNVTSVVVVTSSTSTDIQSLLCYAVWLIPARTQRVEKSSGTINDDKMQ